MALSRASSTGAAITVVAMKNPEHTAPNLKRFISIFSLIRSPEQVLSLNQI
jgi:hypothetical protein